MTDSLTRQFRTINLAWSDPNPVWVTGNSVATPSTTIDQMHLPDALWKPEFTVRFQAGQTVLKEGELGNCLFVLLEGRVEVQIKNKVIGTFDPIETFGEMSVIDGKPRSATVTAKTDCVMARIDETRFQYFIQQKPEFGIDIMRMLVDRIRWMDSFTAKAASADANELAGLITELEGLKTAFESRAEQIGQVLQKLRQPAGQ